MRICLLGECRGNLDEGMRNITLRFAEYLSKNHQILALDLRDVFFKDFWGKIRDFKPDIIHYLHGPTIRSFILAKIISLYCRDAKIVMSGMRPVIPYLLREFVSLIKPDLILTQSYETENMFKRLGCKTEFLPIGVDINKFRPVPKETKKELRQKYGFDEEKFIILHIGSIKKGRNVQLLTKLQRDDNQILIVGSSSTGIDPKVSQSLMESGCLVWVEYIKNIEEIYALSDCYIYPTVSRYDFLGRAIADSIEMPLSVLEAMSCNLPVITTKFGALPRAFKEGDGLFFVENENDIFQALEEIRNGIKVKTREKVLPYSWENVVKRLEEIYERVLGGRNAF